MTATNPIVRVSELTKVFNKKVVAVDNVSFEVEEGEIFGFLGPNGAGKTTTINILTTLLKPTSGHATVAGLDVEEYASEVRAVIGLVPQELTVDDELTGRENIELQAKLYHVDHDVADERIDELMELVGLIDAQDRYVRTYSGGMRKRLELAEGLVHQPKVLFLDEPTLGLDVQTRAVMWEYIKDLNREKGITLFMTTHYLEEADALCDRLAIIDEGAIVAQGSPADLKQRVGGDAIEVTLSEGHSAFREAMADMPLVNEIQEMDGGFRLKTTRGEKALPRIFQRISKLKVEVQSVSMKKPSLDGVFLELTGRRLRDVQEDRVARELTMKRTRE